MAPSFELNVMPGSKLQLLILHPAGALPPISVCAQPMAYPRVHASASSSASSTEASGWELINAADASPLPGLAKLAQPVTQQALRHLPLLEAAFSEPAGLCLPVETATERTAVCLKISLVGQIVAPSVTKGCAVAQLKTNLQPVPEHCRCVTVRIRCAHRRPMQSYAHDAQCPVCLIPCAQPHAKAASGDVRRR